ncbi:MAG TPA: heparan-alpha-glucosaminide N-acetyltransferase domain-containing protein [Longimicrobiales bacterium]|nr:heparan-alpha-glucosaminide N-acetyltransferase domain-containing protein [Longimicrobiales bacterium]
MDSTPESGTPVLDPPASTPPPAGAAAAAAGTSGAVSGPSPTRLHSLDAFRGATIAAMLLVNNPGTWSAIHPPLRHAPWHGWTPTDLIFPFFLFIVGVAMTFSFASRSAAGADRGVLMRKATRRAAILFGLGLILHAFPNFLDLSNLRIPGVLQRIALAYLAATALVLYLRPRGQAVATAALLLGYWALLMLVPFPGGTPGVLEPGMDIGAWVDRLVFGEAHLWSQSRTWDPEGLLSTLPAVATVMLGVFTGGWLRAGHGARRTAAGLFGAGVAGLLAGLAWGMVFPINKPIWTSSYVVLTAGLALLTFGACYWVIDVLGYRRWAKPFVVFGVNAIAAFFLSGLFARLLTLIRLPAGDGTVTLKGRIYDSVFVPLFSRPENASLAYAITFVLVWLGIMTVLYRRRIFIKV